MGTLICDINLFSMEQPVYIVEDSGQMALEFQAPFDDLGKAIVDYCQRHNNIDVLKILDSAGYAKRLLIPAMKDYAFHNYSDFNVKIEVQAK